MSLTPVHLPVEGSTALLPAMQEHERSIDALRSGEDTTPARQVLVDLLDLHAPILLPAPPWWSRMQQDLQPVCRGCGQSEARENRYPSMRAQDPQWPCRTYLLITQNLTAQASSPTPQSAGALPFQGPRSSSRRPGRRRAATTEAGGRR